MFVIPILGIIAPMFLLCGAIAPVAGLIKFIGSLFGYDVPYVVAQFGSMTLSPVFTFLYSIVMGGYFGPVRQRSLETVITLYPYGR